MKSKTLIVMSVAAGAVAFLAFAYQHVRTPPVEEEAPTRVSAATSSREPAVEAPAPVYRTAPPVAPPPTRTELRRQLWDATDVLAAVQRVRVSGSPDEKAWAGDLLRECSGFRPVNLEAFNFNRLPLKGETYRTEAARKELEKRCAGVIAMPIPETKQLWTELYGSATSGGSTVQQLRAMAGDTRWNSAQTDLLKSALYSGDPAMAREAANVLITAIDKAAPGGQERSDAILLALIGGDQVPTFGTTFETLEGCAVQLACDGKLLPVEGAASAPEAPPSATQALVDKMRQAVAAKKSPQELLAIR